MELVKESCILHWSEVSVAAMRPSPQKRHLPVSPSAQISRAAAAAASPRRRPAIPIVPGGGRGMDRPKRSAAAAAPPFLPDDALVEILSRLPAKSLFRFKCVSKTWHDLIAGRLRCNRLPQTLEGFFYAYDGTSDAGGGVSPDRAVHERFINTLGKSAPLASLSFLGKQPGIEDFAPLRSCNGLLLLGHRRAGDSYDSLGYIVCNPATEQWVTVPSSGWKPCSLLDLVEIEDPDSYTELSSRFTYLIFDPVVSSHFQLAEFCIWTDGGQFVEHVHTYSSETGVWKRYNCTYESGLDEAWVTSFYAGSILVNGMLHFSVTRFDIGQELIVAVDGGGMDCRFISSPEKQADVAFVGQSQGRLHYMTQHRDSTSEMTQLSIWVLQDYDAEKWVLKHSVTFLQLFGRMNCDVVFDYKVVAIHLDRNSIFFVQWWDLKLKSYDMDSKEVCTLRILGFEPQNIVPYVPYFAESSALANKH